MSLALPDSPNHSTIDCIDSPIDMDPDENDPSLPSTPRRRKRGARKGKGQAKEDSLDVLAAASENLAREISKSSRPPSVHTTASSRKQRSQFQEPASFFPVPTALCNSTTSSPTPSLRDTASWRSASNSSLPAPSVRSIPASRLSHNTPSEPPAVTIANSLPAKKSSKWKLSFGKANGSRNFSEAATHDTGIDARIYGVAMSATASNVSDLIMGLSSASPPAPKPQPPSIPPVPPLPASASSSSLHPRSPLRLAPSLSPISLDQSETESETRSNHSRGRRSRQRAANRDDSRSRSRHSNPSQAGPSNDHPAFHFNYKDTRAVSPSSTVSLSQTSSGGSLSSAATSTSAFSRFSAGSVRSLSTTATTASSSSSWRHRQSASSPRPTSPDYPAGLPVNIKYMTELPKELQRAPREHRPVSTEDSGDQTGHFPRKQRSRKLRGPDLGTINERPGPPKPPQPLKDASTSTTDLGSPLEEEGPDGARRLQRAPGNTLTKMLHVLRL